MKIMLIGKLRKPITLNKRYQDKSKERIANDSIDTYMKNIDYRIKPLEELLSILKFYTKPKFYSNITINWKLSQN